MQDGKTQVGTEKRVPGDRFFALPPRPRIGGLPGRGESRGYGWLRRGESVRTTAARTGKVPGTVQSVKKALGNRKQLQPSE